MHYKWSTGLVPFPIRPKDKIFAMKGRKLRFLLVLAPIHSRIERCTQLAEPHAMETGEALLRDQLGKAGCRDGTL